jgi:HD-GYP domain-containing protein (c-di-GMP phosphodiesterase class II)
VQVLHRYADSLGMPLMCVDVRTGKIVLQTDRNQLPWLPREFEDKAKRRGNSSQIHACGSGLIHFSIPLPQEEGRQYVAAGYVLAMPGLRPPELEAAAANAGWSDEQLDDWLSRMPYCQQEMLRRHLSLAVQHARQVQQDAVAQEEIDQIISQLNLSFQEINLLHTLTQNMQVSRAPEEIAGLTLSQVYEVVQADAHAVWLCGDRQQPLFVHQGRLPFEQSDLARLVERFEHNDWSRPLVKNNVEGTLLGADFPGLRNFMLAPIAEGNYRAGWLFSCNLLRDEEFSSVQVNLLTSVASILGTHGRNQDLFRQHEELLLSFVKSLVSSLDAKDAYTRGHSERVALIARRLGTQLKLPEDELRDIYLSGLLHDIGKIGIDDQILRKPGALSAEEFEKVKEHPVIGYNILAGLKNLNAVIPGVRHHHEAWAGTGYPDQLAGEEIPLMARIMAVADAYDAMGSDRPYRKGMPIAKVEDVLRSGSGKQWDPRVIEAFFACKTEVHEMCRKHQQSDTGVMADVDEYLIPLSSGRPAVDRVREALTALTGLPAPAAIAGGP